jgi:hypothetical protein
MRRGPSEGFGAKGRPRPGEATLRKRHGRFQGAEWPALHAHRVIPEKSNLFTNFGVTLAGRSPEPYDATGGLRGAALDALDPIGERGLHRTRLERQARQGERRPPRSARDCDLARSPQVDATVAASECSEVLVGGARGEDTRQDRIGEQSGRQDVDQPDETRGRHQVNERIEVQREGRAVARPGRS